MTEPTGTEAHPAYNRVLDTTDLTAAPRGFQAIDAFGVVWTKNGDSYSYSARWSSVVETAPGLTEEALVDIGSPIRRVTP